jgi:hypothetical protein
MLRAFRPFRRPARIVQLVGGPILELLRQLGYLLGGRAVQQHPDALSRPARPLDPAAHRRFPLLMSFIADIGQAQAAGRQIGQQRRRRLPQHRRLHTGQRPRAVQHFPAALPVGEGFLAQLVAQRGNSRRIIRTVNQEAAPVIAAGPARTATRIRRRP